MILKTSNTKKPRGLTERIPINAFAFIELKQVKKAIIQNYSIV